MMNTPLLYPYSLLCELTYSCPLQCPYCSNPVNFEHYTNELDTQEWQRILDEAAALGVVQVTFFWRRTFVAQRYSSNYKKSP